MPTYTIRDPETGKTLTVRGDSPPTEQELTELFSSQSASPVDVQPEGEAPQPIGDDEPDTYIGGFLKGAKEGVIGGAKGFGRGLARSPLDLAEGIAGLVTTNPLDSMKGIVQSVKGIPEAVRKSATDPEGWGEGVGSLTGQQLLTAGASKGIPMAGRLTGRALSAAGEHSFPWQLAAAHQMMSGNIPMGVGLAVGPEIMSRAGGALTRLFGGSDRLSKGVVHSGGTSRPPSPPPSGPRPIDALRTSGEGVPRQPSTPTSSTPPPRPESMRIGGSEISPTDPLYRKLREIMESGRPEPKAPSAPVKQSSWPPSVSPDPSKFPMPRTAQEWAEARRMWGAEELGRMTGKTAEEVRQLAPGPSRTPSAVSNRMLDAEYRRKVGE